MKTDLASPFDHISKIWRLIPKYTKIQFCSAFIIGLLVHIYIMTNGFINHDSVMINEYYNWIQIRTGRWFAVVPDMISGSFNLMWINTLFALIYLSISACLIGACLETRRTPLVLLLSGIVMAFPTVAGWFSYRFLVDVACFSVLLACLAIFLARRYKDGFIFGFFPLLFSIATYQAFVGFFAGIMVLMLIRDLLGDKEIKTVVISALKYLFTLVTALVAYVLILKLPVSADLSGYKGISSFGHFSAQSVPERFVFSYQNFFDIFFRNSLYIHQDYYQSGRIFQVLFILAAIAVLVTLVNVIISKKISKTRLVLLLVLIVLIPPTCNVISILSPDNLYILMQYSLVLFFAFMLMIADIAVVKPKAVYLSAFYILVFCFIMTANYAIYSNVFYQKVELVNKQGQAFSSALVTKIQSEDFYDKGKMIVIYGEAPLSFAMGYFETVNAIPLGDIPNMYSFPAYLNIYFDLQNPVNQSKRYMPDELGKNADAMEAIHDMPSYPLPGSIAEIEGMIVVKFSD